MKYSVLAKAIAESRITDSHYSNGSSYNSKPYVSKYDTDRLAHQLKLLGVSIEYDRRGKSRRKIDDRRTNNNG